MQKLQGWIPTHPLVCELLMTNSIHTLTSRFSWKQTQPWRGGKSFHIVQIVYILLMI